MANLPDFDGRFENVQLLAERELSVTYFARSTRNGREVFLKMLCESKAADADCRSRFLHEAAMLDEITRAVPALEVPPILERGDCLGRPWFAQQWLAGFPLSEATAHRRAFDGPSVMAVIESILILLDAAHTAGFVHGDISPDNIFVVSSSGAPTDGRMPSGFSIRLVDFNSAERVIAGESSRARVLFTKPAWVAPEVVRTGATSPKADLFSLGVIFYQLLSGDLPFAAQSLAERASIGDAEAPRLPPLLDVPEPIESLMRAFLAPDPSRRIPSASEALRQLRELLRIRDWLSAPETAPAPWADSAPFYPAPPPPTLSPTVFGEPGGLVGGASPQASSDRAPLSHAESVPVPDTPDQVDFSAFGPGAVIAGTSFVLEIWAHLREQRDEMLALATKTTRIERGMRRQVEIARGTELTLQLRLDGFEIEESVDSFRWLGEICNVAFLVKAPVGLAAGIHPGQVRILHCGILLSRLVFDVCIGPRSEQAVPLQIREVKIGSAFASYATNDREEVLRRVQGINATGIDVFLDVLSLRAGQDWEAELLKNLRSRDIFYLFWSPAASRSTWVEKEWRWALKERGLDYIHPIPLVDPREAPPPTELSSKHFNDLILACLKSAQFGNPVP